MPNGRCRMHGGKSLAGIASPAWKHGKYSDYMPQRLQERFARGLHDPDLLSLDNEIALLDAHVTEKLEKLRDDVGDGSKLWPFLQSAYDDLRAAAASGNTKEVTQSLLVMGQLIQRGFEEHLLWSDILVLWEERRKLVETEQKRRIALQLVLNVDEAMAFQYEIGNLLQKYLGSDRKLLQDAISELRDVVLRNQGAPIRTKQQALASIASS